MIGVPRRTVVLREYNEVWSTYFEDEKKKIIEVCNNNINDIEHVGSTSVKGLIAKPIIDIAATYSEDEAIKEVIESIVSLGYEYVEDNGIDDRLYFAKRSNGMSLFHIHVYHQESMNYKKQIIFRDYLRKNENAAKEYCDLKEELYHKYKNDRPKYTEAKTTFIFAILKKAIESV